MTNSNLKSDLVQMIERESDVTILEAIYTILQKTALNPIVKEKLSSRALRAEEDIKSGRTLTREDIVQRSNR